MTVGKLFFPKTAAGNLVRNRRFFFPYLLTGLLTVAMFYNITFLAWHQEIRNMPGGETIPSIMYLGVIVIGIFSVIFLLYTNSFLIKRRYKEIGLYNILGMSKRHIALVLLWETIYTCLITIVGGLLLGILLSKLLLMILYKVLFFSVAFGFSVNPMSLTITTLLFVGIYLVALGCNLLHVRLSKPVELLRGGNVGEKEPKVKYILTILGLLTLGIGYYIAISTESPLDALMLFFLAVILVIVGTYCLFTAGSIAFLKAMKKRKSYYYQAKHFIGISGMLYRMKQNAIGLANICILSTMVLVMISTCVCMYLGVEDAMDTMYPHDITYTRVQPGGEWQTTEEVQEEILTLVQQSGLTPKKTQAVDVMRLINTTAQGSTFSCAGPTDDEFGNLVYTEIITAQSYTQITGEPLKLAPNQVVIYTTENDGDWTEVTVLNKTFSITQWLTESPTGKHQAYSDRELLLIVSDVSVLEELLQQKMEKETMNGQANWDFSMDFDGMDKERVEELYDQLRQLTIETENTDRVSCRAIEESQFYTMYGGFLFLGLFLGALFLMATVLIIYYKQISEGYEDKERFAILEKVGMSQHQIRASIRSQVRTVFFLPLIGAVIHLAVAFKMIVKILSTLNLMNLSLFALCCLGTVLVFGIGYLVIYRLTARTYYKIVR